MRIRGHSDVAETVRRNFPKPGLLKRYRGMVFDWIREATNFKKAMLGVTV
jgi:hypothetical protein